ncbi:dynein gamma flagellar outer, partial [Cystoisospora suis]
GGEGGSDGEGGGHDSSPPNLHERIANDKEILKVLLLLTGSIQNTRDEVAKYLVKFDELAWLWRDSIKESYEKFAAEKPSLDEFERHLKGFVDVETRIQSMEGETTIGVLLLNTSGLLNQLTELVRRWNLQYLNELHHEAKQKLEGLTDQIRQMSKRLKRQVVDIDVLRHIMDTLNYIREKES